MILLPPQRVLTMTTKSSMMPNQRLARWERDTLGVSVAQSDTVLEKARSTADTVTDIGGTLIKCVLVNNYAAITQ